jgi:hypothetical protein
MLLRQFAPTLLADATLVEMESRYERQAATGPVSNSRTVVPASSRACPTHGGFSRVIDD